MKPPETTHPGADFKFIEMDGDKAIWGAEGKGISVRKCPYRVGDRLWVPERWRLANINAGIPTAQFWTVQFADYAVLPHPQPKRDLFEPLAAKDVPSRGQTGIEFGKWRSPIHMPQWAARLWLEIVGVRAERLQDISGADARAEGVTELPLQAGEPSAWWTGWREKGAPLHGRTPQAAYRAIWDSIHGPGSWGANQWVWVYEYKRVEGEK